jgi:hypothetical protein
VYPQLPFQAKAIAAYYAAAAQAGKSPVAGYTATGRGFPDVSLAGLNYKVYIGGQLYSVSGTSASAPVMAGLLSNLNSVRLAAGKPAMGWANPALYTNSSLFINDITSGDNKCAGTGMKSTVNCCPQGFTAIAGWDPVTGLGTVDYGKMESTFIKLGYFSSLASAVSSAQRISYEREIFCYLIQYLIVIVERGLPCLALPCLALPCLALPCLALPCLALPCLALLCFALPVHSNAVLPTICLITTTQHSPTRTHLSPCVFVS